MIPLTQEQVNFVIDIICKWMNICEDNGRSTSSADVSHSALLNRMLLGGPVHANPPPCRMSYPAWELVENEEIEIHSFFECKNPDDLMASDMLFIDQCSGYSWVDKENKIIQYDRLGIRYQYFEKETVPIWVAKGYKPEDLKYMGKFLRRLNDPPTGKEIPWKTPKETSCNFVNEEGQHIKLECVLTDEKNVIVNIENDDEEKSLICTTLTMTEAENLITILGRMLDRRK